MAESRITIKKVGIDDVPFKTCAVRLASNDGVDMFVADVELEAKQELHRFADKAFDGARNSLRRLNPTVHRLVVIDGDTKEGYSLTKWVKLIDAEEQDKKLEKAQERAKAKARARA